ncbi:MAG: APC family permease [Dehalococcoidales bacterium]|nr:APC family permease [Dehalococcoidales bacterium]
MPDQLPLRPGDRVYRPRRIKHFHLKKVLGVPALFSAGYGDVGSSIYYALGIVALVALGATPIVLGIAGILYIFNALTYAEGSAMIPEAGGSASFARHGFGSFWGFVAGWALMLSYIATMAISAYTIPPYLSYFWPVLNNHAVGTFVAIGLIFLLMVINVLGIRESATVNIFFIVFGLAVQIALVVLGIVLILAPEPSVLWQNMFGQNELGESNWPSLSNFIMGIAIAALCFTGVETVSQLAEETRKPTERIPQAYVLMIVVVLLLFGGISVVALSAMTPRLLGDPVSGWARDPIAGIAAHLPSPLLRGIFEPLVAVLGASILLTATNAGLLGISRLTYNMSSHGLLPMTLGRIHHRFRTPHMAIILFCAIAILMLCPGFTNPDFFVDLGAIYVFGSLLCFAFGHAAIIALRVKRPDLARPFRIRWNLRTSGGRELPVTALLGLLGTGGIWVVIMITQPFSRWAGLGWMACGMLLYGGYVLYRRARRKREELGVRLEKL